MAEDEIDAKGEEKIDADGKLLGGREFVFPVFTLPRHPTRLYAFSLDAAKALDYRDTYIFFTKNTNVKRVNGSDADREYLTEKDMLPPPMKNRNVTLVTARNVFRVFGHQIIKRGRPIRDDYFVGDKTEEDYYKEAMQIDDDYKTGIFDFGQGPHILGFGGEDGEDDFRPEYIPPELRADAWMYKVATSTAGFNRRLVRTRPTSFLDLHTNIEQVSQLSQPSRVQVELLSSSRMNFIHVEDQVVLNKDEQDQEWKTVSNSDKPSKFPLAIMNDQHQDVTSLYVERFSESDPQFYSSSPEKEKKEKIVIEPKQSTTRQVSHFNLVEPDLIC